MDSDSITWIKSQALPVLPAAKQGELALRAQKGDRAAREKLIRSNLLAILHWSKKFARGEIDLDDAIAQGMIGFNIAIDKWDAHKGANLLSYAAPWIRAKVRRFVDDCAVDVRIPTSQRNAITRLKMYQAQWHDEFGQHAEVDSNWLRERLNVSDAVLQNLIATSQLKSVSLQSKVGESEESELGELLPDEFTSAGVDAETLIADVDSRAYAHKQIAAAIRTLRVKERIVIMHLYLTDDIYEVPSYESLGSAFGNSRECVRQLEASALRKLNRHFRRYDGWQSVHILLRGFSHKVREAPNTPALTDRFCRTNCGRLLRVGQLGKCWICRDGNVSTIKIGVPRTIQEAIEMEKKMDAEIKEAQEKPQKAFRAHDVAKKAHDASAAPKMRHPAVSVYDLTDAELMRCVDELVRRRDKKERELAELSNSLAKAGK